MTSTSGYLIMKKGNRKSKSISEHLLVLVVSLVRFLVVPLDMERSLMELSMSNLLKSHGLEQLPDNPTSRRIANQGDEKMGSVGSKNISRSWIC